jgi:hypothetical protein
VVASEDTPWVVWVRGEALFSHTPGSKMKDRKRRMIDVVKS